MKKTLLLLLISVNCFGYKGWAPAYREVQVRDERDHYNEKENRRLREENERLQRRNETTERVVYIRPTPSDRFELLTEGDKITLKYVLVGILLAWLIFRK